MGVRQRRVQDDFKILQLAPRRGRLGVGSKVSFWGRMRCLRHPWGAGHVSFGVEERVPGCRYNVGRFSVWMMFRRGRVTVGRPGRFRYATLGRERVSGCWK